jgi:transcriptional regulator with XRE-family HTH domain
VTEPFDVQALWNALDEQRRSRSMTWAAVGRATGVSPSTLTRTQRAMDLEADGMVQMTRWLGVAPEAFCRGPAHDDVPRVEPAGDGADEGGILRVDTAALYAALEERRTRDDLSWTEVAAAMETGRATPEALRGLRRGGRVSVQLLLSITRWLGTPSTEFFTRRPV